MHYSLQTLKNNEIPYNSRRPREREREKKVSNTNPADCNLIQFFRSIAQYRFPVEKKMLQVLLGFFFFGHKISIVLNHIDMYTKIYALDI